MSLVKKWPVANEPLAKTLDQCEATPGQWNCYSESEGRGGPASETTLSSLLIRKGEQKFDNLPCFDVVFMAQGTIKNGQLADEIRALTSREFNEITGIDHIAYVLKQTGDVIDGDADAIFHQVTLPQLNALQAVNKQIALMRTASLQLEEAGANLLGTLELDVPKADVSLYPKPQQKLIK